jgi:carboxymethylenebutenolidase
MPRITTESVDSGYLAIPEGGGPGLIVLHDVWGLSDHFRDLARRFAAEGFVALAVDLYRSLEARPLPEDPGAFMRQLSDPLVLAEIQRAVDFLRAHPDLSNGAVGVVGFCMGGAYAILAGAEVTGVSAVAPFYGILSYRSGLYASPNGEALDPTKKPREPLDAASNLRCPIAGFYGAEDAYVTVEDVRELERRAKGGGHSASIALYGGAGHAFMNDTRAAAFRPAVASQAWETLISFLHDALERTRARE